MPRKAKKKRPVEKGICNRCGKQNPDYRKDCRMNRSMAGCVHCTTCPNCLNAIDTEG